MGEHRPGACRAAPSGSARSPLAVGGWALWHRAATNGGEPFAVARIEPAPAPPPSPPRPPPAVASPAATQVGAAAGVSSGAQVEASSGVKVVRSGGGGATNALIIEVPQALGVRLTPAPDKRLVERSHFGLLPRVGADGARPADVYARPVVEPAELKGAPRVAIMVGGLGIDEEGTIAAIDKLPAAVSLAFAPYGADLDRDAARAREAGHEILLQAPMEPFGSASAGPGPHTLTTAASEAENLESLHWLMSRFTGYIGVTNYLGGKLSADTHAFSPVLAEIATRGLDYLDDGSSPRSLAREIAANVESAGGCRRRRARRRADRRCDRSRARPAGGPGAAPGRRRRRRHCIADQRRAYRALGGDVGSPRNLARADIRGDSARARALRARQPLEFAPMTAP